MLENTYLIVVLVIHVMAGKVMGLIVFRVLLDII